MKTKERHAVTQRETKIVDGVFVDTWRGSYEDGPPEFGLCNAVDCPQKATIETLIGLHFCSNHFSKFYSDDDFKIDQDREFPSLTEEVQ